MRVISAILLLLASTVVIAQAQVLFQGNVELRFANGSISSPIYLVLDNPSDMALRDADVPPGAISDGGMAIHSENEFHIVKWNIGSAIGNYSIPFHSITSGNPVPVSATVSVIGAGSSDGAIEFATYATDTDNSQWPKDVLHLTHAGGISESVAHSTMDRFWIIDPAGVDAYTSKPVIDIHLHFDPAELDAIPDPNNMLAQRFNPLANSGLGSWADYIPNTSMISNGPSQFYLDAAPLSSSNEFYRSWTISSSSNPLPIQLLSFSALCIDNGIVELDWATGTESNNSHFKIESSLDGYFWNTVSDSIPSAGNSSTIEQYNFLDYNALAGLKYYRLSQVDFNGEEETFQPITSDCEATGSPFEVLSCRIEQETLQLTVHSDQDRKANLEIWDLSGRIVLDRKALYLEEGRSSYKISIGALSRGIYTLSLKDSRIQATAQMLNY